MELNQKIRDILASNRYDIHCLASKRPIDLSKEMIQLLLDQSILIDFIKRSIPSDDIDQNVRRIMDGKNE